MQVCKDGIVIDDKSGSLECAKPISFWTDHTDSVFPFGAATPSAVNPYSQPSLYCAPGWTMVEVASMVGMSTGQILQKMVPKCAPAGDLRDPEPQ